MDWAKDEDSRLWAQIWRELKRAEMNRRLPWRTPIVTTTSPKGSQGRVVVLRTVDFEHETLSFHTDSRSPKADQLRQDPRLQWIFWDPRDEVQLRVDSRCTLHQGDEVAKARWQHQHESTRVLFSGRNAPGTPQRQAEAGEATMPFSNFMWVETSVRSVDWLWLKPKPHVRKHFDCERKLSESVIP